MILKPSAENIKRAAELLQSGKLVAFPTETVYGLGANALNPAAVQNIFEVKGRPSSDPLIVHLYSAEQVSSVADLEDSDFILPRFNKLSKFWPGPLSIVLPKRDCVPSIVTAGLNSVAVRIPAHPVALELLKVSELPLAAPSANPFSYVSPTSAQHVEDQLGAKIELILDGGASSIGIESTVVSLVNDQVTILRPGAVTKEMLEKTLGEEVVVSSQKSEKAAPSPGMFEKHYSPRTRLAFRDEVDLSSFAGSIGLISFNEDFQDLPVEFHAVNTLSTSGNKDEIARNLYNAIREQDGLGLDLILIDRCDEAGIGMALMDRLRRAVT